MARDFTNLNDGDELHPYHINEIYKELRRWRWTSGTDGVIVERANSASLSPIIRGLLQEFPFTFAMVGGSGIASGSLTSPGSGTVTPYHAGASGSSSGALVADSGTSPTVTAYNIWSTAVTASKPCLIVRLFGEWYVAIWDC